MPLAVSYFSFPGSVLTSFLVPTAMSESLKGNHLVVKFSKKVLTQKQPVLFFFFLAAVDFELY